MFETPFLACMQIHDVFCIQVRQGLLKATGLKSTLISEEL